MKTIVFKNLVRYSACWGACYRKMKEENQLTLVGTLQTWHHNKASDISEMYMCELQILSLNLSKLTIAIWHVWL